MSQVWHPRADEDGTAIDVLLEWLVPRGDERLRRSIGEWLCAYQRLTHYCRALDIWSPPPHLLAWSVIERAVNRTSSDREVAPVRLALEELQAVLHISREAGSTVPVAPWTGRFKPVPEMMPAPMVPQPLEVFELKGVLAELANRLRQLGFGSWWRRHA